MPYGFKRDVTETIARNFRDKRSFIALNSGCEVLFGLDMVERRREVYERAKGRCEARPHSWRCKGFATWENGELHHTKIHDGRRCSCFSALEFRSRACHSKAHEKRNPRWTRNREAVTAFEKLYKETK